MTDLFVVLKGGIQASVDAALAAQKGAANGIAPLDAASKVPAVNSRVESVAGRQGAVTLGVADVSGALNKAGDTMTGALVLAADPVSALQPVTKQMLDAFLSGLDAKPDVRLASNTNHALTGAQSVDGVAVVTGDRILLKNQTVGAENGVWVASTTGAWTRATDADTATKIKDMYTFVAEGAVGGNRDTGWLLTTDAITLGTTALVYGQFSGPGSTLAGTGLTRSGNTISASFGTAAGTITQGNDTRLSDTRTPTDGAVTPAKMSADNKGVIICTSTTRPASPVEGQLIYETDTDQVLKNTGTPAAPVWANTATASAAASETAAGVVELATATEAQTGTDAVRAVHPAGLKSAMNARRGTTRVSAYPVSGVSIAANTTLTTVDLRGLGTPPIPADAKGVEISIQATGNGFYIAADSADVTPDGFSPRLQIIANGTNAIFPVPFGTGVNAGKINLRPNGAVTFVTIWPIAWWR